jgi:PAS domain S-box-containing protein
MNTAGIFEKAFTQSDYAINITDAAGILLKVNQAFLNMYKFASEQDVLGKTQRIIRSPHTPLRIYQDMWKTIIQGNTWRGNFTNVAKDGAEVFVHLTITPIRENEKIIGYMGFSLDRAQQVLLERELFQANKLVELGTMGAGLAHELNNPLASILLDAEFLRDVLANPGKPFDRKMTLAAADSVINGVEKMKRVLEHLLIYSRKEKPQQRSTLLVSDLIRDSFLFIEKQIRSRGIDIKVEVEENLAIPGNLTQLESVIHNLLANSRDAFEMQEENPEKLITIGGRLESNGNVCITYKDNAGGIPDAILEHIFEPFFTTKSEKEGTGLGLSISKKIITEHGGRIRCESREGSTTFFIHLPSANGERVLAQ